MPQHDESRAWALQHLGLAEPRHGLPAAPIRAENATTTGLTAEQLMSALNIGASSSSGELVSADAAMRVATVYRCVSLIAGAIASLPLGIYERSGADSKAVSHDYWWMFNEQASDGWTSYAAWQYLISSKMFHGDGFAELLRPSPVSSRVIGWQPLRPQCVNVIRSSDRTLYYHVTRLDGTTTTLDAADVLHLPSLGFDGLRSPSPITFAAREAIGTSIAAERFAGKFFSGGATFDYALKTPATLKPEQVSDLRASLLARASGNSRAPLILTGNLEPVQLSINNKDAEILATRIFGVEEICRVFGVPPQMVGSGEKTAGWAGSSIEQLGLGFVRYTLMPLLTPLAQEINRKLWPTQTRHFVSHTTSALERGDLAGRAGAHRIAIGRAGEPGWMTINEVRRIENLPPVPGGDTLANGSQSPAQPAPTGAAHAS